MSVTKTKVTWSSKIDKLGHLMEGLLTIYTLRCVVNFQKD